MSRKKPRGIRKTPKVNYRRRDEEFAGLKRELHPKTRWEYLDMDYIDSLSTEDKKILSKFIDEYYGASLTPADQPENWKNDFHSSPELRKECMDRNNARNRDMYTILRTRGMVESNPGDSDAGTGDIEHEDSFINFRFKKENGTDNENHENVLNEFLDREEEISVILKKAEESVAANPSQKDQPKPHQSFPKEPQKT